MELYERTTAQRGASIVETMLSVVLVALVTFTAINRYGATLSALMGRDLVGALGGKVEVKTGGVGQSISPITNPVTVGANPLLIGGGSSVVGGGLNVQPSQLR